MYDQDAELERTMERIAAGRTKGLVCPFCKQGELAAQSSEYGTRYGCGACRRYLEAAASF